MKVFISVIIILALLICGFVFNYFYLKNKSDIIMENLITLEKYAYENNGKKCDEALKALEKSWNKRKNVLFIFSNHKELDDIYKSILKIQTRIEHNDFNGAIEEIKIAKHMIYDVPHKEIPTLSNIF